MKINHLIKYIGVAILMYAFASCSKMDDTYDEFLVNGETIYVGKADSVKVNAGNNRVQLQWLLIADQKVSKYKVYWNNRTDSLIGNVQRTPGVDTIRIIIDKNLREGPNNFEIFTFDKQGNSSVKVEARGNVYSSIYQSEIASRPLSPIPKYDEVGTNATLNWLPSQNGETQKTELTYTDKNNVVKTVFVPVNELVTVLPNYKLGSSISYKSYYIPEPTAIDTFVTASSTATLPLKDTKLNKALFKEYFVTGTTRLPGDQLPLSGWPLTNLWNDKIAPATGNSYASANIAATGPELNRWVTFDLGVVTNLSRYRVWQTQDRTYTSENAFQWEIWGTSATPAADGSFNGWTLLTTSQSIKPSGTPLDTNPVPPKDVAYAEAGQEFIFPSNIPEVRYIRVKVIKNYKNQTFITFGEMTFWTKN